MPQGHHCDLLFDQQSTNDLNGQHRTTHVRSICKLTYTSGPISVLIYLIMQQNGELGYVARAHEERFPLFLAFESRWTSTARVMLK
jgi:hypothetical protein